MRWDEMTERERNLLVAEHVFGVTPESLSEGWPEDWPTGTDENGCPYAKLPDYVGHIACAWNVVEEMREAGVYIDVEPRCDRYDAVAGWAGSDDEGFWAQAFVTGGTAPEVICKAALRAKGVEV